MCNFGVREAGISFAFQEIKQSKGMNDVTIKATQVPPGTILFVSDYSDTRDDKAVSRILSTLEKRGVIIRIGRGVYLKPEMSRFGVVYPSVTKIAEAIARRDNVQILPCGATAENILGLSTQVPMTHTFLTSGSAREINVNGRTLKFKRGVPKNFAFENKMMALLAQALKSIGKDNIGEEEMSVIRKLIHDEPDKASLRKDIKLIPGWMKKIILNILNTEDQ